jgi:hypothetical protein
MTDEERLMLRETHAMATRINRALFEVPPGSPDSDQPLIEGLVIVWRAYQRGSWVVRMLVWLIPTIAGLGASIAVIKGWLPWSGN